MAWMRVISQKCSILLVFILVTVISFQYYLITVTRVKKSSTAINGRQEIVHQTDRIEDNVNEGISRTPVEVNITQGSKISKRIQPNSPPFHLERFDKFSPKCKALIFDKGFSSTNTEFPYKIYIYDLPEELNVKLAKCAMQGDKCFDLSNCGLGEYLHNDTDLHVFGTWQFALEVIIHHKLMLSTHRTLDPEEADIFYVPYYGAAACFCWQASDTLPRKNVDLLLNFLQNSSYYRAGKPHLLTVSKIEREEASSHCPLIAKLHQTNVRYIGIEQQHYKDREWPEMIVAPYPSYGHLHALNTGFYENTLFGKRNIFVFMAASTRRSNSFRALILDQLKNQRTPINLQVYLRSKGLTKNNQIDAIWLSTAECHGDHKRYTLEYMKHSTFCLQPPGDSPTRKSFYDGLISGCIPVLFKEEYPVKWPFMKTIPYENITVTLSPSLVYKGVSIVEELRKIPKERIQSMQNTLAKYIRYFQYSYPPSNRPHDDAIEMILKEASQEFNLHKS